MSEQRTSKQQLIIDELRRRARKKTGSYELYEADTAWVAVEWLIDEQTSRDAWMKRATEAEAEIERLRAALERAERVVAMVNALPVTTEELIRVRNAGKITFDKMVNAITSCLIDMRRATDETKCSHDRQRLIDLGHRHCPRCREAL